MASDTMIPGPCGTTSADNQTADRDLLKDLPTEIRYNIYEYLTEGTKTIDISTIPPRKHGRAMRFKCGFPKAMDDMETLIDTYPELEDEINSFLGKRILFTGRHSSGVLDLPRVFGEDNCARVIKFELRWEFRQKVAHQETWPKLIHFFVNSMPNLESLALYSEWWTSAPPYPQDESEDPEGSITRLGQEKRAKLRFLTFLLHNHHNLDLLICPARTGHEAVRVPGQMFYHNIVAEKYRSKAGRKWKQYQLGSEPQLAEDVQYDTVPDYEILDEDGMHTTKLIRREYEQVLGATMQDEVMNATLLTRLSWADYRNLRAEDYFIRPNLGLSKDTITTSLPIDRAARAFARVVERGYKPYDMFQKYGWIGPRHVDGMIQSAKKHLANIQASEAQGTARGRRIGARERRGTRGRGCGRGKA